MLSFFSEVVNQPCRYIDCKFVDFKEINNETFRITSIDFLDAQKI